MQVIIANKHLSGGVSFPLTEIGYMLRDFCIKYDSDAIPDVYVERVLESYYKENPGTLIFLGVDESNLSIVAHCVVHAEDYYGSKYFFISQYENRSGKPIPKEVIDQFFGFLVQWGKANGINKLRVTARNKVVARALRKYGMSEGDRTYLELNLKEE